MKKSQSALEFLTNYGWAMIVAAIVIGILVYSDILSPYKILPQKCVLNPGFACLDYKVEKVGGVDAITLVIQNSLGFDVSSITVNAGDCGTAVGPSSLLNDVKGTYIVTPCSTPLTGKLYRNGISIAYTKTNTGISYIRNGTLVANIMEG